MSKLSEIFKNIFQKIKELSMGKKIAYGLLCVSVIAVLGYGIHSLTATKYDVLFSNMDSTDQGAVIAKLKEKKVSVQYKGNSILVPKDQVDQLRMELMSEVTLTNGSQGFEILDKSKFGSTDAEMKINFQRALQGELERTIKSFPEVENARVLLVMPEDTVFNKDVTPGSASVTVILKQGKKLTDDQVKGIVSLISGSVRNIPKENVEVIDDKMTVLSKDLFNEDKEDSTTSAEKQQDLKKKYETDAQTKVLNMLEAIYGKGKVKVTVNADLNFDAIQNQKTTYDPKGTIVSEHNIYGATAGTPAANSMSPVDNNMQAAVQNNTNQNNGIVSKEETKNYNITKSEDKVIKAPGEVKRLTTSVVINGNLSDQTKASINNLVVSAVGYNKDRGDTISVEGLKFDSTIADQQAKEIADLKKLADQEKKYKLYKTIGIAAGSAILLLISLIALRKKKDVEEEDLAFEGAGIDVLIDDEEQVQNEPVKFKPIEFEVEDERTHFENEIKKYASDKPEQVADIIKSWLAEDER